MCGPGTFVLRDKMIVSKGGMGLLWYTKKKFRDFTLRVDWKPSQREYNSGVFVRFADPDDDQWIAVNTGYEIQTTANLQMEMPRIEQELFTILRHLQQQ